MICNYCGRKIVKRSFKRTVTTCHPTILYYEVDICYTCHYFPSNNVESKERLIK